MLVTFPDGQEFLQHDESVAPGADFRTLLVDPIDRDFRKPVAALPRDVPGTALWDAVTTGDTIRVSQLLSQGVDPDVIGPDDRTPLMLAIAAQRADLVSLLLRYRANPNVSEADGRSALGVAVELGAREMVTALLQAGASVETPPEGETLLVTAIRAGDEDVVLDLLQWGAPVNDASGAGDTPLVAALRPTPPRDHNGPGPRHPSSGDCRSGARNPTIIPGPAPPG